MINNDEDYLIRRTYTNYGGRKMCEYCEKAKAICKQNSSYLGMELHSGTKQIITYGCDAEGWDISISWNINYCPMCR